MNMLTTMLLNRTERRQHPLPPGEGRGEGSNNRSTSLTLSLSRRERERLPLIQLILCAIAVVLLCASPVSLTHAAKLDGIDLPDLYEPRYRTLINELRCLVCQNETLADSNAELAVDLRREIRAMLVDGKSDAQITEFLVARYGDYVLYNPPVKPTTLMLWYGPFVLLALGTIIAIITIRRRGRTVPTALSATQQQQVQEMLRRQDEETHT